MFKPLASYLTVAAAAVMAVPLLGQQPDRPARGQGNLFDRIDANKDGVISADEVPEERKSFFERLLRNNDKNSDGKISRDEFASDEGQRQRRGDRDAPGPRPGQMPDPERMFRFLDRNSDGKVTAEEIPEPGRERFQSNLSRADKDGDGALNLEEFKAGAASMAPLMGRRPGEGGPPNLANAPFFRAIDADQDGRLSADELSKAGDALKKLDRDGDGFLTPNELAPPPGFASRGEAPPTSPFVARLKEADTNGDGKLSKEEAPERMRENFDRIDTNSDGFIDEAEMRRLAERFRENQGNPPRRRPQSDN